MTRCEICVITFRRPAGLDRLLAAIAAMSVPDGLALGVVVVDNDPDGSARSVVESARAERGLDIAYAVETTRGIPAARNRALAVAAERNPDLIGWMDDDEAPSPNWLRDMVETQRATGADVVLGPNEPVFEDGAVAWIAGSGLFTNERFPTGTPHPYYLTRTSGVLLRSAVVPDEGFDERLALTGGTDRIFFTLIHRAGGTFAFDERAVMEEHIPASRARPSWLLKRWFRIGVTKSLTLIVLDEPGLRRRLLRVGRGALDVLVGLAATVAALPRGRVAAFSALRGVALGAGTCAGVLGFQYREYKRTHGS